MSVKISTTNSKLGLIPSVNLVPILTCRDNCPCAKDCYATKGRYRFENVKQSLICNYKAYTLNPKQYFREIKDALSGIISYRYFRWHAAGDIVDEQYFSGMVELAKELPNTSFLAFTKKFYIINNYLNSGNDMPDNLHIVFSAWGDEFQVDNPYHFPVAHVRFKDKENKNIPNTAVECSGDCTNCLQCWKIKHGESVVFNKH